MYRATPVSAQACEDDDSCDDEIACSSDSDCPSPLECDEGRCVWDIVVCSEDSECDELYVCGLDPMKDHPIGLCVPHTEPCEDGGCATPKWQCFDPSAHGLGSDGGPNSPVCFPEGVIAHLLGRTGNRGEDEGSAGTLDAGARADAGATAEPDAEPATPDDSESTCSVATPRSSARSGRSLLVTAALALVLLSRSRARRSQP